MVLDTDTYACGYMIKGQVNGNLSGGQICWQNVWDSYVKNMKEGFGDFIKFAAFFAMGALLLPGAWMTVLFYIFMAMLIVSIIAITVTALYEYYTHDGDPSYLEEALGQLLTIITYLLIGKAIDAGYKAFKGKTGEGPKVDPGEGPGEGPKVEGPEVGPGEGPGVDLENLTWAPNGIKGQHDTAALEEVVSGLRDIQEMDGSYEDVVEFLVEMGRIAKNR